VRVKDHSITASARSYNNGGMVRPSDLAVFMSLHFNAALAITGVSIKTPIARGVLGAAETRGDYLGRHRNSGAR
jgi:hypothetical protein